MKSPWRSKLLWLALVLLAALLVVRAMLPIWVRDDVNKKLSEIDGYRGHVTDVDIHLWRGAYTIHEIEIVKTEGHVPVPFFEAPVVDLSIQWTELFHGALVSEINFERPELNFVNSKNAANTQIGVDKPWTDKIKELFPVKFNRFTVHDGEVHYRDFSRNPKVNLVIAWTWSRAMMAAFPPDLSPFQIGTRGEWKGRAFEIVGRLRMEWAQGSWNEWCLLYDGNNFCGGTLDHVAIREWIRAGLHASNVESRELTRG